MSLDIERARRALVILSVGVSLYYLFWRLGTLNREAMIFSTILYGAELYGFIASLMFFYMVWKFPERSPKPPKEGLKVDVFIPTLNEDLHILKKTIQGALSIRYPHRTYVLDDGNRPEVMKLCDELGCEYISRAVNKNGKAGNLNNALSRTEGDFIAVFDADHVPEPDFLDETLGYFEDEKVAFVQTPQDFYNIDSYQHRITKGKLWSEQSLFFKVIMRGKDRHNSSFFCGSCAVLRRRALEDIGDFATGTVTEDIHTSLRLHAKGWKSVYHPKTLAYGIAPSTFTPYRTQRERWGQGAMQVFFRENPLLIKGLSLPQRINYFASMTTYLDGFQKAIFYVSPAVVLFTGVYPISVGMKEFLPVFLPHLFLSLWAFEEMSRGHGKLLLLEQYNMARFFSFMKSVLGLGKKLNFKVTDKKNGGSTKLKELLPQLGVLGVSLTGVGYALLNFNNVHQEGVYAANIFWALLNSGVASACVLWSIGRKNLRGIFRFPANFPALMRMNGTRTAVTLDDLNERGVALLSQKAVKKGDKVELSLEFQDEELLLEGEVLYSSRIDSIDVSRVGVRFGKLDSSTEKRVNLFNFRFLLKKYMEHRDVPSDTPLSRLFSLLQGKKPKREKRFEVHLPGMAFSGGEFIPYTTEDIGINGVRILTYKPLSSRELSFSLGIFREEEIFLSGKVIWSKEVNFYGIKAYRYGISFNREQKPEQHVHNAPLTT